MKADVDGRVNKVEIKKGRTEAAEEEHRQQGKSEAGKIRHRDEGYQRGGNRISNKETARHRHRRQRDEMRDGLRCVEEVYPVLGGYRGQAELLRHQKWSDEHQKERHGHCHPDSAKETVNDFSQGYGGGQQ